MNMKKLSIPILALALLNVGCMRHRNHHVLYLDPDGAVTWTVIQEELRSDEAETEARAAEEQAFLISAMRAENPVAAALRLLGPSTVDVQIVRDELPYMIVNEARFAAVDRVLQEFMTRIGLDADVTLEPEGDRTRLTLAFAESDESRDAEDDDILGALVEPLESYRFVLTRGRIVEAHGFSLDAHNTSATLLDPEEAGIIDESGSAVYVLIWEQQDR